MSSRAWTTQEVTYEGYGPGGVALLIYAVTDNPTRTVAEVRHKISRGGGNLGTPNSVSCMFEKKGQIYIDASKYDEDALMEAALEAGAEDFRREDDQLRRHDRSDDFHTVKGALEAQGRRRRRSRDGDGAEEHRHVAGKDAESLLKLIEELEDLDDVQKVWANFDIDDAELAKVEVTSTHAAVVLVLGIDPGTANTGYGVVRGGGPAVRRRSSSAA